MENIHRLVIIGGGAGGLELATKLGNTLGKKKIAEIILIDAKKPTSGSHYCMRLQQEV